MIERRLEILGRVHVVLEQELHGAFARFPSLSHTNLTMPEVSGLGKRKNEDSSPGPRAPCSFPRKTSRTGSVAAALRQIK